MKIIKSINEMHRYIAKLKRSRTKTPNTIGFIPTMGYFHDGHLSLMLEAAKEHKKVVVSIFVNPTQFAAGEDLEKYPRDEKRDIKMLKDLKVIDCVFIPEPAEMYPDGYASYLQLENEMPKALCGASRPTHFKGVTTVVAKLLNIVNPDSLYLGQKDMQQAIIIEKMVKEMNYPAKVRICPTVREKDGLAMSSRNEYLSPSERNSAPILYKSLQMAESMVELGERKSSELIKEMKRKLKEENVEVDYIEVVSADTLQKTGKIDGKILIAAAIIIGKTRLIDNTIVEVKTYQ